MPNDDETPKGKALHQLMEEEFQQLVDIIEQKKIAHEDLNLEPPEENDPILEVAARLHERSEELGAESLAEFFYALEGSARSGNPKETADLLQNITNEFESVRKILDKD